MFRAFNSWRERRRCRFDGFRQKQDAHESLPRFGPPEGKDIHPACLILYCRHSWSWLQWCADEIWLWSKKRCVLAYVCGIYARSDVSLPFLATLLTLIWGVRSRDPVQVSYRCIQTLISLGLLGLRVSILFLGCSRYAKGEARGVVSSSPADV
jgi:hypothetical protein